MKKFLNSVISFEFNLPVWVFFALVVVILTSCIGLAVISNLAK